jgi:hypothetical protein
MLLTCSLCEILGYSATCFFLLFAQWFLGDSDVFYNSEAIHGYCCFIARQPFNSQIDRYVAPQQ